MVRLDDPMVSLKHAELSLEGGLFRLKDLGSRTGTRVNGAPVLPRQPLEPTDEISIGPFRLRVTTLEPESIAPPSDESAKRQAFPPSVPPSPAAPIAEGSPIGPPPAVPPPPAGRASARPPQPEPKPAPASITAVSEPPTYREPARIAPTATRLGWLPSAVVPGQPEKAAEVAPPSQGVPKADPGFTPRAAVSSANEETTRVVAVPTKSASQPSAAVAPQPLKAVVAPPVKAAVAPLPVPGAALGESVATQVDLSPSHVSSGSRAALADVRIDTPREVVPLAFAVSEVAHDGAASSQEDDEDDDDDSDFVPPFDLLDTLSRSGLQDDPERDRKESSPGGGPLPRGSRPVGPTSSREGSAPRSRAARGHRRHRGRRELLVLSRGLQVVCRARLRAGSCDPGCAGEAGRAQDASRRRHAGQHRFGGRRQADGSLGAAGAGARGAASLASAGRREHDFGRLVSRSAPRHRPVHRLRRPCREEGGGFRHQRRAVRDHRRQGAGAGATAAHAASGDSLSRDSCPRRTRCRRSATRQRSRTRRRSPRALAEPGKTQPLRAHRLSASSPRSEALPAPSRSMRSR